MTPSFPIDLPNPGAMHFLLDLELPVLVRFGSTKMLLKDLLKLDAGSVIEFNSQLGKPVEVLVNGRTVARGEAVVVQGNYGVRILEVVADNRGLSSLYGDPALPAAE
jgi:flagellar motor switch protein FliN/FliY